MIIFASGQTWLCVAGDDVKAIAAFPRLEQPATLLWSPDRGASGVAALEGDPRHAAVLIERKLRGEGSIEGDAKVFIHHVRAIGKGYQALYTVARLDEWQRLLGWVEGLKQHCLLVPVVALLWDQLQNGSGAVFRFGAHFAFLGKSEDHMVHVNTIAFSDSVEDALLASRALAERVREDFLKHQPGQADPALRVRWHGIDQGADIDVPAAGAFLAAMTEGTADADVPGASVAGVVVDHSPMADMAAGAGPGIALNSGADKWRFLADRWLPACGLASMCMAAIFLAVSASWVWRSLQASREIELLRQREVLARQKIGELSSAGVLPATLGEQLQFLESLQKVRRAQDVAGLLRALKDASSGEVRILGVRAEEKPPAKDGADVPASFVIDGMLVDGASAQDSILLSNFVRAMRDQHYELEPVDGRCSPPGGGHLLYREHQPSCQARRSGCPGNTCPRGTCAGRFRPLGWESWPSGFGPASCVDDAAVWYGGHRIRCGGCGDACSPGCPRGQDGSGGLAHPATAGGRCPRPAPGQRRHPPDRAGQRIASAGGHPAGRLAQQYPGRGKDEGAG